MFHAMFILAPRSVIPAEILSKSCRIRSGNLSCSSAACATVSQQGWLGAQRSPQQRGVKDSWLLPQSPFSPWQGEKVAAGRMRGFFAASRPDSPANAAAGGFAALRPQPPQ